MTCPITRVFGPAYLDRVLRVDSPLRPTGEPPIDGSAEALASHAPQPTPGRLTLIPAHGPPLTIQTPALWPGPTGTFPIATPPGFLPSTPSARLVRATAWLDDLGGMGAGFAAALRGTLTSALGPQHDPISDSISTLLQSYQISHNPARIPDRAADWTLLVTSGPHGDKLAVGFRGCHAALSPATLAQVDLDPQLDLLVVAGLSTAQSLSLLTRAAPRTLRLLAPSIRTLRDLVPPLSDLAPHLDLLSCNHAEWTAIPPDTQARLRALIPLIAVTLGPRGARLLLGDQQLEIPAFPRTHPPRDTNRAGEAFASTLIARLWLSGWRRGQPLRPGPLRSAAQAATAAAALVLDLDRFGFPTPADIDSALDRGFIAEPAHPTDQPSA